MTDRIRIVYQDRILRITKFTVKESHRYKIEITDGRFFKSWQKYYVNDEEAISRQGNGLAFNIAKAIKGAKREFGNLFDFKGGSAI